MNKLNVKKKLQIFKHNPYNIKHSSFTWHFVYYNSNCYYFRMKGTFMIQYIKRKYKTL